jgi:ABC-type cobalamin/Fe3+-siderophores transport system ATPase subunit
VAAGIIDNGGKIGRMETIAVFILTARRAKMELTIEGIGKIKRASIRLDGITVVAGKNNTGKSTFGRTLYCMFTAFYHSDQAVLDMRRRYILQTLNAMQLPHRKPFTVREIDDFLARLPPEPAKDTMLSAQIRELVSSGEPPLAEHIVGLATDSILESLKVSNREILENMITRLFLDEFNNQINHLNCPDSEAVVSLLIRGNKVSVTMRGNKCVHFEDNVGIYADAIYIDTPLVLDNMHGYHDTNAFLYSQDNKLFHRNDLLAKLGQNQKSGNIVSGIIVDNKIKEVLQSIGGVVSGEFAKDQNSGGIVFHERGINAPLEISNLSAGTKQFLLLKRLLETNILKERGVLIIDEPEIHLHPAWQVQFAEILILLQKQFNLNILLTTHSHYFLSAIEEYSKKFGVENRCNYYLAHGDGVFSESSDITGHTEVAYDQLAEPIDLLDSINQKAGNDDD